MASLGDLSVLIGAEVNEAGFTRAVNAIGGIETAAKSAGTGATTGMAQVAAAAESAAAVVDKANQRITDSQGRVRDGYGKFVTAAQLAAEAAGNVGGSLGNLSDVAGKASASINSGLVSSFAAFDKAIKPLEAGIGRLGESLQSIGGTLTVGITLPLAAAATAALKVGGDFNSAFNRVAAATQAAGAELDSLRKKAQNIALDPDLQFSSVQAAQALENLAKNGLTTAQILGGAADASTALATATGGNLATAADITTDVMNNFGKSAEQAAGLVDSITGSTIASKFSIDDYKLALGQAGAVAGQLGVDFKDFNTALSVTSSGFSSGSDAGTSFKTFLQRLVPTTKEAATAMQQLGLNFFDAKGKMLPLRDIAGQLQKAFQGLSDQQKNNLGTQIFGADSIRTALLLAKEGTEGFDRMAESIGKVNAASQGKILNAGFAGALEAFKSSAEGLLQAIGDSGLLRFGEIVLRAGADVAAGLAKMNPAVLQAATVFGGVVAAAGPVVYVFGSLLTAIPPVIAGLEALGLTLGAVLVPLGVGVAAVAAAAYLIIDNWGALTNYFSSSGEGGRVFSDLADSVENAVSQINGAFSSLNGGGSLADLVSATGILKAAFRDVAVGVTAVANVVGGAVGAIVALLNGDLSTAADQASRAFVGLSQPIANVLGFQLRLADSSGEARKGFEGAAGGGGVFGDELLRLSGLLPGVTRQLQGFAGGFPQYAVAAEQYGGILEKLRARLETLQGQREKETTVGAIKVDTTAIDAVQKQIDDLVGKTSKGTDAIAKAFEALQKGLRAAEGESTALGDAFDYISARRSALQSGIKGLIAAGLSPTSDAIKALVKDLKSLPEAVDQIASRAAKGTQSITPDFELKLPDLSQDTPNILPDYKFLFADAAAAVAAGGGQVAAAFTASDSKLTDAQANTLDRQRAFNTEFENLVDSLSTGVGPLVADFAAQFGAALGSIVTGSASASDALAVLFGGIVSALGDFMTTFGKQLIVIGIGKLSLDTLFSGPQGGPLAIAAGLGLVALGGIVSAVGKSAAASISSIGSGGASLASQPGSTATSANTANQQPIKIVAEFKLRGADLVASAKVLGYRTLNTQG